MEISDLSSINEITMEDKVILLACRKYMIITGSNPSSFFTELFDIASQVVSQLSNDFSRFYLPIHSNVASITDSADANNKQGSDDLSDEAALAN